MKYLKKCLQDSINFIAIIIGLQEHYFSNKNYLPPIKTAAKIYPYSITTNSDLIKETKASHCDFKPNPSKAEPG